MTQDAFAGYFKTAITNLARGEIYIRGYPLAELIGSLPYGSVLYLIMKGELPDRCQAAVFEAVLCGIVDHSLVSAAAPASRFVVSGNPDPIKGIAAGVLSIGPHTASPRACGEMLARIAARRRERDLSVEQASAEEVAELRARKARIPGLGHPLHEVDPRATRLREVAAANGYVGDHVRAIEAVAAAFQAASGRRLPVNVDGMMAALLSELGFDPLEMDAIAVVSYLPGIIAHTLEELRSGVPLRTLSEPIVQYIGPPERHLPSSS